MKRQRREQANYVASLTACEGTWLERAPDTAEQERIRSTDQMLRGFRTQAAELGNNREEFNRFSLDIFREERWAPLYLDDWVIETVIEEVGEPPVVTDPDDLSFSNYLLQALGAIATSRFRRAMAEQARRFLPIYLGEGRNKEALAIGHNAYMTVMSEAATPLLVQTLVGGLARYYESLDEEEAVEADGNQA
ncbi:MAG TPA: hypothetical protein PKA05_10065 [Roseiflexaceae bacterium]|nr:hypothetical protein [Roseiflexaceae bacterium]HMP40712.1 hypothetical protein [Roseiflexaceae bacterium]